ncbi:MAG TPA: acylphosphatase [Roseiarcus sp.]|nr:acylphosphatase [Roseiarcus sp.]
MLLLVPQKAASAAGSEARMDCGTALAEQARLHPCGEALRRRSFARRRAPAPAAGFARKPLKSHDSRKKEAWISLPLALNFLPNDLDFPSPGFANPSPHFVKYSRFTWNTRSLSGSSTSAEAPLLREGSARRFKTCECGSPIEIRESRLPSQDAIGQTGTLGPLGFANGAGAWIELGKIERRTTMKQEQAISATVAGNDQQVGFRAMVMKQAKYNLAGTAENEKDEVVRCTLQGDAKRLKPAIEAVQEGTKKSSNINVTTTPATVDPKLNAFTIVGWTSTSRNITTPYNLVFTLRENDETISENDAKAVWRQILESTLKGDDLKKLSDKD